MVDAALRGPVLGGHDEGFAGGVPLGFVCVLDLDELGVVSMEDMGTM